MVAVVVEGGAVHDTTVKFPSYLRGHRRDIIPSYIALTEELQKYGCKTIIQLVHSGGRMSSHDSRLPLWAPSDVRSAISPEIPHSMTAAEINDVLDGYEVAFENAAEAGVDGVEIHAAHEYLLGQFLSPLNNRRGDNYGGSLDNRMRLLSEVIMLARKTVGDDLVVGVRINGSDLVEASLDNDDYIEVARNIEAIAAVDYLSISAGTSRHNHMIVPPMDTPEGLYVDYASAIRAAVTIPVMAVGRLKDPDLAENVIASGHADVVAQARALIADPAWVAKLAEKTPDRIRPCIGCNQGCFGYLYTNRPITCAVNPAVGHERELGIGTEPDAEGSRVPILGGQIPLASSLESRAELGSIVDFQIDEIERLAVEVLLDTTADLDAIAALDPQAVVDSTGSRPRSEPIPGDGSIPVVAPIDVMAHPEDFAGQVVVVIDEVAHFPAYAPAEALIDAGATVTVLTPKLFVCSLLDQATMTTTLRRLATKGVRLVPNSLVTGVAAGSINVRDTLSGAERTENGELIVAAVGNSAVDELARDLEAQPGGPEVHVVGDAAAPRTVLEAIREGRLAGRAV